MFRIDALRLSSLCSLCLAACTPALKPVLPSPDAGELASEGSPLNPSALLFDGILVTGEATNGAPTHVQMRRFGIEDSNLRAQVDATGHFALALPAPGVYFAEIHRGRAITGLGPVQSSGPRLRIVGQLDEPETMIWRGHDLELAEALGSHGEWSVGLQHALQLSASREGPHHRPEELRRAAVQRWLDAAGEASMAARGSRARGLRALAALDVFGLEAPVDRLVDQVAAVRRDLSEDDPAWPAFVGLPSVFARALYEFEEPGTLRGYLGDMADRHPDPGWSAAVMEVLLEHLNDEEEIEAFSSRFSKLMNPRFEATQAYARCRQRYE